jgi:hypothetical protein
MKRNERREQVTPQAYYSLQGIEFTFDGYLLSSVASRFLSDYTSLENQSFLPFLPFMNK